MRTFEIDDELVSLIWQLANPRPFENPSFNDALWRVIRNLSTPIETPNGVEGALAVAGRVLGEQPSLASGVAGGRLISLASLLDGGTGLAAGRRLPTPSAKSWVAEVPDLSRHRHLTTWKAICDHLDIETGFDSARRKLRQWVRDNKPDWPPVPDVEGLAGTNE